MRRYVRVSLIALSMNAGLAGICAAQSVVSPELVTDRPDFTESSEVVGHRVIQIESGLTFEQTDDTTRQVTAPQLLVRVGVGQRFELRFAGDGFVSQSVETPAGLERAGGHSDAEFGAKWKFFDQPAVGFDMAVIPFLSLPTASDRTKPTPGAYHLFSPPDSSNDHSLVRRQFVKVPAGTITVSPTATICPMSSAQFG